MCKGVRCFCTWCPIEGSTYLCSRFCFDLFCRIFFLIFSSVVCASLLFFLCFLGGAGVWGVACMHVCVCVCMCFRQQCVRANKREMQTPPTFQPGTSPTRLFQYPSNPAAEVVEILRNQNRQVRRRMTDRDVWGGGGGDLEMGHLSVVNIILAGGSSASTFFARRRHGAVQHSPMLSDSPVILDPLPD